MGRTWLTQTPPQLGDTRATTAAVDLHEALYFLQHVSPPTIPSPAGSPASCRGPSRPKTGD
ncbi:hypothetical protein IMZ48_15385 [Candidatus Bathyarchaeota archaeon]|nr:hypothetical protein [Candidatus Bathyarchaeota archaeon]